MAVIVYGVLDGQQSWILVRSCHLLKKFGHCIIIVVFSVLLYQALKAQNPRKHQGREFSGSGNPRTRGGVGGSYLRHVASCELVET